MTPIATGGVSAAARRRRLQQRWVLGIDVGATNIRAGLVEVRSGEIHCAQATQTEATAGKLSSLRRLALLAGQVASAGKDRGLAAAHVGVGIPELVGCRGEIESHCALQWNSKDVRETLQRQGRVTIESDVRAAALAEARLGAGRGFSVFLYLSVGTGISCTLVLDGKPYAGAHGHAISFASGSTLRINDAQGRVAYAPLETQVAGPGLLQRARAAGSTQADSLAVCRRAGQEEGVEREVVDAAATELAVHVAIVANATDPALIVMGGGLGSSPGRYWTTFRAAMRRHLWGPNAGRIPIRRAALGSHAGLIGAALAAAEAVGS